MAKARREFTPEFKREAVALLKASGRPQMQIATELGIGNYQMVASLGERRQAQMVQSTVLKAHTTYAIALTALWLCALWAQ